MDALSHKPLERLVIPSLLERAAAAFADRPAMSFQGRRWTYRELAFLVDRATAGLQRLGLRAGDRVGLCMPNTPYSVIFYYAALKAGLVVVNYNPLYVARELRHQIADSATTTMIVPDIAAIFDKVFEILPDSGLERIIVCPFAEALPTVKRLGFAVLKRNFLPARCGASGLSPTAGSSRPARHRRRCGSIRRISRCCNTPAARRGCRRGRC